MKQKGYKCMNERNIDYVPISKLSRGYAGKIIEKMNRTESVIFILRNNEPTAVLMPFEDYDNYLKIVKANKRINRKETISKLAGSLHDYADVNKVEGEKEFYRKALRNRHEQKDHT